MTAHETIGPSKSHRSFVKAVVSWLSTLVVVSLAAASLHALWSIAAARSWDETLSIAFPQLHRMLLLGLSFFIAAAIWRRMSVRRFALLVILVTVLVDRDVFDGILHSWLVSSGLHPMLWLGREPNDINPQWVKLIIVMPFVGYGAVMVFRRSWRSLDRLFLLVIATSVVSTIALFHPVIEKGITAPSLYELKRRVEDGLTANDSEFRRQCARWPADCFVRNRKDVWPLSFDRPDGGLRKADEAEIEWFKSVEGAIGHTREHFIGLTRNSGKNLQSPPTLLAVRYAGDVVYGASLKDLPRDIDQRSNAWFCFLAICAHSIWIFGGIYLLLWHKRPRKRR